MSRRYLIVGLVLVALIVAACSGGSDDAKATAEAAVATTEAALATTEALETAAAANEAEAMYRGQIMAIVSSLEAVTMATQ
ncbi:MAG: hypothetical protein V3U26_02925, partial [Dehalococcoidia bacterium]